MVIRLTPTGQLRCELSENEPESTPSELLLKAFKTDWREGLLMLAAEKIDPENSRPCATGRIWQNAISPGYAIYPEQQKPLKLPNRQRTNTRV
jgi:hypothetical protein